MDSSIIVSITDFRRNAGAYISKGVPLTIIKDSKIIGNFVPAKTPSVSLSDDLEAIEKLAGGFNLGNKSPKKLQQIFESSYE